MDAPATPPEHPEAGFYLSGLDLRGRRVLVAGAGRVATRRIDGLLRAGAEVEVVAPTASDEITALAAEGRLAWRAREAAPEDLAGAWYALLATDSPQTNHALGEEAHRRRVFCVRADDAGAGTARTPAVRRHGSFSIATLGHRDPRGSARLADLLVALLRERHDENAPPPRSRPGRRRPGAPAHSTPPTPKE